jgi:hypothetical protein
MNWQPVTTNTTADLRGVSYGVTSLTTGASAYVAVGASGTVLTSTDGVNWTVQTLPGGGNLNAVTFGLQFIAVGAGGRIFTSADGVVWVLSPPATSQNLYAVAHGSLDYSAVGAGGSNLLSK